MKLCQVSRDLYYQILRNLDLTDINQVLLVNKECYQKNDEFWKRKSYKEFPALAKLKPDWIDYMEWYQRLINSGNLYRHKVMGENKVLAQNVIKCAIRTRTYCFILTFLMIYIYRNFGVDSKTVDVVRHKS